jgi:hypothetical protein
MYAGLAALAVLAAGAVAFAVLRPAVPPAPSATAPSVEATPQPQTEPSKKTTGQADEDPWTVGPRKAAEATATPEKSASASITATTPVAVDPAYHPLPFDTGKAMAHARVLSETIGQRVGGTTGESRAIEYARRYLASLGYEVAITPVPLPNGRTSHNVAARKRGATGPIVVLGGHVDTKAPAPGADDNASGCGTVLELARDFATARTVADVRFVLFGTEELIGDGNSDHHHFGSRAYVRAMPRSERDRFAAMVSIDMIGYGPDFRVRTMGVGTRAVADGLIATARRVKAPLSYLRDPGSSGWSDHEPFERAGLPAAWLEWRDDPNAHTPRDTYGRLHAEKVRVTGVLTREWLSSLSADALRRLVATR